MKAAPIRVCHIVGNMVGGGVEHAILNYLKYIDPKSVLFDFIITEDSTLVPEEEIKRYGGRIFIVPSYKKLCAFNHELYKLFSSHKEWKIVHSHLNALSIFPLREAKRAGIPIRIAHSHTAYGKGEPLRNGAKAVLKLFANRYPTHRLACSEQAGRWLFGKKAKYKVLYNGIEIDKFRFNSNIRDEVRRDLDISNETFLIGHVGRFVQTKNQIFLIQVFEQLKARRPASMLCFVGSGEMETKAKKMVLDRGLVDSVLFLGQREDVENLYQAFDIFVMPSLYEGLGLACIEAQVSGLQCLLSDRVSQEANLSDSCIYLPISGLEAWTDLLAKEEVPDELKRIKINYSDFSDYDIKNQSKELTKLYLALYREIKSES